MKIKDSFSYNYWTHSQTATGNLKIQLQETFSKTTGNILIKLQETCSYNYMKPFYNTTRKHFHTTTLDILMKLQDTFS